MRKEVCELNRIIHFEIPVDDIKKATDFYARIFGWDMKTRTGSWGSFTSIETGKSSETGINGSFFKKSTVPQEFHRMINIIEVADINSMMERVKTNGGSIIFGPIDYVDLGKMVYFRDTEGNILGMLEPKKV